MRRPCGRSSRRPAALRGWLHRLGYDVVRHPAGTSQGVQLAKLLVTLDIDCVIDVGAYVGEWAQGLRRLGYDGRIVSYEPSTTAFRALAQRAREDPCWTIHQAAVGEAEGRAVLRVAANPQ